MSDGPEGPDVLLMGVPATRLVECQDNARADLDAARVLLDRAFSASLCDPSAENEMEYLAALIDLKDSLCVAQEWDACLHG